MVFHLTRDPAGHHGPSHHGTSTRPARSRPERRSSSTHTPGVRSPGANKTQVATVRRSGSWHRELVLLIVLYLAYAGSRLATLAPPDAAVRNAHWVIDVERALHIAPEQTLNDLLYSAPTWVAVAAAYFYQFMHYAVTMATLIWLYRSSAHAYRSARNWLVAMTFPALIAFWLFPVAPPREIPGSVSHDIVAEQHQYGWWGAGGGTAPRGLSALVNENAAMPSLHVGWAIWVGWNLVRSARNPVIRCFGYAYPALTVLVVVSTGNHYVLDVVAGALLAVVAKIVIDRVAARSARRSAPTAPIVTRHGARESRSAVAVRHLERRSAPLQCGGVGTANGDRSPSTGTTTASVSPGSAT